MLRSKEAEPVKTISNLRPERAAIGIAAFLNVLFFLALGYELTRIDFPITSIPFFNEQYADIESGNKVLAAGISEGARLSRNYKEMESLSEIVALQFPNN